ncbi:MAG TPA: hypothetical protein VGO93_10185 [Candidatus Xenobia bacterium]|jgi:hypothetical protein
MNFNKPTLPQPRPQPVVGSSFVLVDQAGAVRAELAMNDYHCPEIRMWDSAGVLRLSIGFGGGTIEEFPAISMCHANERRTLLISSRPEIEAIGPDGSDLGNWPPAPKARTPRKAVRS